MRAAQLSDLLQKGDRVAVSNITGRESGKVSIISQRYCGNIVGGWALGKGGQTIEFEPGKSIPVFATFGDLLKQLPKKHHPNKVIVYSPPDAVYGEIKEVISFGKKRIETIFIITEHVSIEVTAKIANLAREAGIDIIGGNTLGMINTYDGVRVGAVGGDTPGESFRKGSAAVISNSGNMVTTMATYLLSAGIGTTFGISTGKDVLILTPMKDFLALAEKDKRTKVIVLYIEPGGGYEKEAVEMMRREKFSKPVVVYVAGKILESQNVSLGHAGAVVEGLVASASAKMKLLDDYFGADCFDPQRRYEMTTKLRDSLRRGIRIQTLHHLPQAVSFVFRAHDWERDFSPTGTLTLNPWFVNLGELGKKLPVPLILNPGTIIEPYAAQFAQLAESKLGKLVTQRNMRNASYASGNDGQATTLYGYSVAELMKRSTFAEALILQWLGELPSYPFEARLVEMCLLASLSNGPGTISAQGAKLSASAGNQPHTGMIAALACVGQVHGGNGKEAIEYLLKVFGQTGLEDPYDPKTPGVDLDTLVSQEASAFKNQKAVAQESGTSYAKIPCLGHPVFKDKDVNYDPREEALYGYLQEQSLFNVFLEFYRRLAVTLKRIGATSKVLAVNVDAAIACVWLGICWKFLKEKRITLQRATDLPLVAFALGRAAGAAGEFLDHEDHGTDMDMRVPTSECEILTKPRDLPA
ncbi:MAG: hypothetical protein KKE37_06865 [Verrucomicrobia bacterium]|nr:hypothetical protein [Verrucomicrobiota bacterium]MBU4289603.1 hypothetical protein [Verrucomicrobiota bacterium]MBU4429059.1 hypothetical protein [Verrucomicrobiota bacterium]MCG2678745.1 hypothetical protein [Kiritimatiellia bacterium]